MSYTCPHCETEIDAVSRSGGKRYMCKACNKVLKYDDLAPHLDDLTVHDNRDKDDNDSKKEETKDVEEDSNEMEEPEHSLNEREIISQRGREGLKEIKKQRLKNWLSMTDNVGSTTQNRIIMVFDSDKTYRENPNALYNLLDEELSSSASYINTIVNQVFAPEHEHEDLLEDNGYRPYYRDNNANRAQAGSGMGQQTGPVMRQPDNQGGQPQQSQPQQHQQQNGSMSREEAVEMIAAATQTEQQGGGGLGSTASDGLNQATEEAIKNFANNAGGFFQAGQKMIEEALIGYARNNPEKIVENMDMFQMLMEANEGSNEPEVSEQDQKIDSAVDQAMNQGGGGQPQQQNQDHTQPDRGGSPPQQNNNSSELRNPKREPDSNDGFDIDSQKHEQSDSGFEPDEEIMNEDPEDLIQEQTNDRYRDSDSSNSGNGDEKDEKEEGEESFGELFGDLE